MGLRSTSARLTGRRTARVLPRVLPRLLAVVALGTGLALAACNPAPPSWFCLPQPPTTAAHIGTALNHHDNQWQGADGGHGVPLPDGRVAWIFGDTLYGAVQPDGSLTTGWGLAHGSMVIQHGSCFDPFYSATQSGPTSLIPPVASNDVYWPGSGWVSADGQFLHVMASRVKIISGSFQNLGSAVATFNLPSLSLVGVQALPSPPAGTAAHWQGVPFRDTATGKVHLYARNGFSHYTVRFPDSKSVFTTTQGWEYWTGTGWSTNPAATQPMVIQTAGLTGMAVQKTSTGYVAVATGLGGASTGTALGWTGPSPAGPWLPLGKVADTPAAGGQSSSYGAHAALLPGMNPMIVWSVSPIQSLSTVGAAIGVAPPLVSLG